MNAELRRQWYEKKDVQQNIIPCLMGTETCFLVPKIVAERLKTNLFPVRCLKAHASSYLSTHMSAYDFMIREYNLYHSIFLLNGMPMLSYKPLERKEQQIKFFRDYEKYVTGVMFVMDFDGDEKLEINERLRIAAARTIKARNFLRQYKVPYNIVFSGTKGFHLEVRDFPPTQNWKKQTEVFREIAIRLVLLSHDENVQDDTSREGNFDEYIMRRYSLHSWDDFVKFFVSRYSFDPRIYNQTRIWKCPYSYDVATDNIVFPLTDVDLDHFNVENYSAERLVKINLWNRGLMKRQGTISNFWTMARALGVAYAETQ